MAASCSRVAYRASSPLLPETIPTTWTLTVVPSWFFRRSESPTPSPWASARLVLTAASPAPVGSFPEASVVKSVRTGTLLRIALELAVLMSCGGRSRSRTSQVVPRTAATPSRARTWSRTCAGRCSRPEVTTRLAPSRSWRALASKWVLNESEVMNAKAIRAALMATATRAATVRRVSSREGISTHPPGLEGAGRGLGAVASGGARSSAHGNLLPVRSIN